MSPKQRKSLNADGWLRQFPEQTSFDTEKVAIFLLLTDTDYVQILVGEFLDCVN